MIWRSISRQSSIRAVRIRDWQQYLWVLSTPLLTSQLGCRLPRLTISADIEQWDIRRISTIAPDFWQFGKSQHTYRYCEHIPCHRLCIRNTSHFIDLPPTTRQHSRTYPATPFLQSCTKGRQPARPDSTCSGDNTKTSATCTWRSLSGCECACVVTPLRT